MGSSLIQIRILVLFILLSEAVISSYSINNNFFGVRNIDDPQRKLVPSREQAACYLDQELMPIQDYGRRQTLGRDAQNLPDLVVGSDPALSFTYGEFPLESLDLLLDTAFSSMHPVPAHDKNLNVRVVDLGSGCGRLCFYMALTRQNWDITGIEISKILHKEAKATMHVAQDKGWFVPIRYDDDEPVQSKQYQHNAATTASHLSFLQGAADEYQDAIRQADIIFCYSTAWESTGFSAETGAMILSEEWNELLSSACRDHCIVITTDRALDPNRWQLLEKVDVTNSEVGGSTGYIQRKRLIN